MHRLVFVFVLAIAAALGISACSSGQSASTTTQSAEIKAIRAYADPAAETMMRSFQDGSLAEYIQKGDAQFKAAVTQAVFDQVATSMRGQYGNFVSLEFLSTENQQGYLIVHYKAKFQKGQLGLRMVFDADHLVAGQFFE